MRQSQCVSVLVADEAVSGGGGVPLVSVVVLVDVSGAEGCVEGEVAGEAEGVSQGDAGGEEGAFSAGGVFVSQEVELEVADVEGEVGAVVGEAVAAAAAAIVVTVAA